mmetsp:Transcript_126/g.277  ORF Transcript_126/g.277 Transcript_126/m.277 type:complete len:195 (+) Transcript_126:3-587(+)
MDSPELSGRDVAEALSAARRGACGVVKPATDGGYVLLALPPGVGPKDRVFEGVVWSSPDTCLSQVAALGRCGLPVVVGEPLADVDTAADLARLALRLGLGPGLSGKGLGLSGRGGRGGEGDFSCPRTVCPRTIAALLELPEGALAAAAAAEGEGEGTAASPTGLLTSRALFGAGCAVGAAIGLSAAFVLAKSRR